MLASLPPVILAQVKEIAGKISSSANIRSIEKAVYVTGEIAPDKLPDIVRSNDLIVLEPALHGDVSKHNSDNKKTLAGYVSLTGVNASNEYLKETYKSIEGKKGFLLADGKKVEDPLGPGSHMVDIRNKEVRSELIQLMAKVANESGYNALMLDAADSAIAMEEKDPKAFSGLTQATADLVKEVSKLAKNGGKSGNLFKRPVKILVNGGLPNSPLENKGKNYLSEIAPHIDGISFESGYTDEGKVRPKDDQDWVKGRLEILGNAVKAAGKNDIPVLGIEYFDPNAAQNQELVKGTRAFAQELSQLQGIGHVATYMTPELDVYTTQPAVEGTPLPAVKKAAAPVR